MEMQSVYETHFPFWKDLCDADRQLMVENTTRVFFEREQSVHDNTRCTGLFIVKSGRLRIYMLSEEGKEITLYRLMPGDVCMLSASCVLSAITFDVYVDAEEPSECYQINPQAFHSLSERIPAVKIFALETAVTRFSDVMWIMQQIVFMSMDKRLAIFLLDELSTTGGDTVTMTHEQIARHLGTAREVVSRILKIMAADGVLEVARKGIRITDKKKLQQIAH
ncbi:MAG: Crp/Fnr family transcriptional regulator [Oscillospiraceae bacterium]|nr:Crp/Fnr family transcriptional regulator [Oscillospiraceae bacterium]